MAIIGILTIGQSPRTDIRSSLQNIFGQYVQIVERGGLDRITDDQLHFITPNENEETYITKLRNGKTVKIGKTKLLPLLQKELTQLEKEVDVILMLCTGDFSTLKSSTTIIYPDKILSNLTQTILPQNSKLGVIVPLQEQRESLKEKWSATNFSLKIEVASPYEKSDIYGAGTKLKEKKVNMIVLDCMGYNEKHKQQVKQASGLPVLLSITLSARVVQEYLS